MSRKNRKKGSSGGSRPRTQCEYCGRTTKGTSLCGNCREKQALIRKIRAIVTEIKRQALQGGIT